MTTEHDAILEEDRARVAAMHDYKNMGSGKPISTEWQRTSERRTRDGAIEYQWICAFCGTDIWLQWGQYVPHHCEELSRLFPSTLPDP